MEPIVVDANVIVASFLEPEEFHQQSLIYTDGLEHGDYIFHLPTLVIVEIVSAISRRAQKNRLALLARVKKSLSDWEAGGRIILYPLDQHQMANAVRVAEERRLRGADSVVAALADELRMPLKTFDLQIIARFPQASP